jgi:hypothetical protein
MMRRLLILGMVAGLFAGLLALGFAEVFGEPQVDGSIAVEDAKTTGPAAPELVSRGVQKGLGLATALGLYGVALGGLFAIACAFAYGRVGPGDMRATAGMVALTGLTVVALVPFVKYPANPPSVGGPDTVDRRTGLYFLLLLATLLAALLAIQVGRTLAGRLGGWNAALVSGAIFLGLAVLACLALPGVNEVPGDFPATLLWRFRLASLGTQVVLWTALGLTFGALAHRSLRPARARRKDAAAAASPGPSGLAR